MANLKLDKFYQISPVISPGKIVQVGWGADSDGDVLEQFPPDRYQDAWHQFLFVPLDYGNYAIVCKNSGKVVSVSHRDNGDGRWIEQWDWLSDVNDQEAQHIKLNDTPNSGTYYFQFQHSGKYMAVSWRNSNDGNYMEQWQFEGKDWQQFKVEELSNSITLPTATIKPRPVAPDYTGTNINETLPESSEKAITAASLVPFFMVDDPFYNDSATQFNASPYYLLEKTEQWIRISTNIVSPGDKIVYTRKVGISEAHQTTMQSTVDMSLGVDIGLQFRALSGALSANISTQLSMTESTTTTQMKEETITREILNNADESDSFTIYQLETQFHLKRSDRSYVIDPWAARFERDTVTRSYLQSIQTTDNTLRAETSAELQKRLINKKSYLRS
ncbi:RICIN domain-containing protein [Bacillus cereus]|uniref:RICIN domain-containing protein n=1 Tax=Bacillus cereus TaxID=1396 RepID=UPI0009021AE0